MKSLKKALSVLLALVMCLSCAALFVSADNVATHTIEFDDVKTLGYAVETFRKNDWWIDHYTSGMNLNRGGYKLGIDYTYSVSVKNNKPSVADPADEFTAEITADGQKITVREDQYIEIKVNTESYIWGPSVRLVKYPDSTDPSATWNDDGTGKDEYFFNQSEILKEKLYGMPAPKQNMHIYLATYYLYNNEYNPDFGDMKDCKIEKIRYDSKNSVICDDKSNTNLYGQPFSGLLYVVENRGDSNPGTVEKSAYNKDTNGKVIDLYENTMYIHDNSYLSRVKEDLFFTVSIDKNDKDVLSDDYEVAFYRKDVSQEYEDRIILRDGDHNTHDNGVVDESKPYQYLDRYETGEKIVDVFRIADGNKNIQIRTHGIKKVTINDLTSIIKGLMNGDIELSDIAKMDLNPIMAFFARLIGLIIKIIKAFTG